MEGLKALLVEEEQLYRKLLDLIDRERRFIEEFRPFEIEKIVKEREILTNKIAEHVTQRRTFEMEFLKGHGISDVAGYTLNRIIKEFGSDHEQRVYLPLVDRFKKLVTLVKRKTLDHSRLLATASSVLGATIAILRSSGEDEVRGYSRRGREIKKYHLKHGRDNQGV
jgi:hypothetical protein